MRGDESREKRDFSHAFGPVKASGTQNARMTGYRYDESHAQAGDGLRAEAIAIKRRETISRVEPRAAMARGTAP